MTIRTFRAGTPERERLSGWRSVCRLQRRFTIADITEERVCGTWDLPRAPFQTRPGTIKNMGTSSRQIRTREANPLRQRLTDVRHGLLGLHKALIVAEQLTFERIYGRVDSTGQLLQLVMNDPWFTWLHPLSNMVVRIDELMEEETDLTIGDVAVIMTEIRGLIRPSESGDGFERAYYEALQRAPDVVIAHCQIKKLLTLPGV